MGPVGEFTKTGNRKKGQGAVHAPEEGVNRYGERAGAKSSFAINRQRESTGALKR